MAVSLIAATGAFLPRLLADDEPEADGGKLSISRQTTFFTAPILQDGRVDFLSAINQHSKLGITPEINFAVWFWQAVGPESIPMDSREWFFRELGIAIPEGENFISAKSSGSELLAELESISSPWSAESLPRVKQWLDANSRPMKLIEDGVKCSRFYSPFVRNASQNDFQLLSAIRPSLELQREIARAFYARAMLSIENGNLETAWADVLTCHRMSRLVGQAPDLRGFMSYATLELFACYGDVAVANSPVLTHKFAAKCMEDLNELSEPPVLMTGIDLGERSTALETAISIRRKGLGALRALPGEDGRIDETAASEFETLGKYVDWNLALVLINNVFDRLVEINDAKSRSSRDLLLKEIASESDRMSRIAKNPGLIEELLGVRFLDSPSEFATRFFVSAYLANTLSGVFPVFDIEDRIHARRRLGRVGIAIAQFQRVNGRFLKFINELVPTCLSVVPLDPYVDKPLRYISHAHAWEARVFCVGTNKVDDEGSFDDIAISVKAKGKIILPGMNSGDRTTARSTTRTIIEIGLILLVAFLAAFVRIRIPKG